VRADEVGTVPDHSANRPIDADEVEDQVSRLSASGAQVTTAHVLCPDRIPELTRR
jgi:hypothetical protein